MYSQTKFDCQNVSKNIWQIYANIWHLGDGVEVHSMIVLYTSSIFVVTSAAGAAEVTTQVYYWQMG